MPATLSPMLTCLECFLNLALFKLMSMLMSHTPNFTSFTYSHLSCMFVTYSPCTFQPHVLAHVSHVSRLFLACLSCTLHSTTTSFVTLTFITCLACLSYLHLTPFNPFVCSCIIPLSCMLVLHLTLNHNIICYTNVYHLSYMFVTFSPCTFQPHAACLLVVSYFFLKCFCCALQPASTPSLTCLACLPHLFLHIWPRAHMYVLHLCLDFCLAYCSCKSCTLHPKSTTNWLSAVLV